MTAPTCACGCNRPVPDGYAAPACMERARRQLAEIAELVPAARDVAHRQARRGTGGAAGGKPGSQEPIDFGAQARIDAVQNALTTMARDIAETRGLEIASQPTKNRLVPDPCIEAAKWLSGQMEWVRHAADGQEPYAIRALAEIDAAVRVLRGIVSGPPRDRYLGPCGADLIAEFAEGLADQERCEGDVYARPHAEYATCRTCGASILVAEREAWIDEEKRGWAFRASEIAHAYGLNVNTIRSWATERPERKAPNGVVLQRARPAKLGAHGRDRAGRPLYLVGDVLDLAAQEAARRAQNEAKRNARQAAEMGA